MKLSCWRGHSHNALECVCVMEDNRTQQPIWLPLPPSLKHLVPVALHQVRAMQIIDELEVAQRGPYGGGIGHVSFTGGMDVALALRTMVIPHVPGVDGSGGRSKWTIHLQVRGLGGRTDSCGKERACLARRMAGCPTSNTFVDGHGS